MKKRICDEQNGLHDFLHGDYYLPDLVFPERDYPPIGKYGRMRKTYLMEHHKGRFAGCCGTAHCGSTYGKSTS